MFRAKNVGFLGLLLVVFLVSGCVKEEKFTIPEETAPWHENLMPSGTSAGGGGSRQRGSKAEDSEQNKVEEKTAESEGQVSGESAAGNQVSEDESSESETKSDNEE